MNISFPAAATAVCAREEGAAVKGLQTGKRPTAVCPLQDQLGLFTQAPPDCVYSQHTFLFYCV